MPTFSNFKQAADFARDYAQRQNTSVNIERRGNIYVVGDPSLTEHEMKVLQNAQLMAEADAEEAKQYPDPAAEAREEEARERAMEIWSNYRAQEDGWPYHGPCAPTYYPYQVDSDRFGEN